MTATATIIFLWLGFAGTHMLLSSLWLRPKLVGAMGEAAFRGLYSLVAFACFIPLVWVYFGHKHEGPVLWNFALSEAMRWLVYLGIGTALVLLICAFVQPSPSSIAAGDSRPRGILRLTRHPLLWSIALFGFFHLIPNGFGSDVAFFGGFALFAVVGAWHQDQRKLATVPEFRAFRDDTPFVPFTGRDTLRGLRELPLPAVAIGIALTVVLRYFHSSWFGG